MKVSLDRDYFFEFVWSSAARNPRASLAASSLAQKCMKNSLGPPSFVFPQKDYGWSGMIHGCDVIALHPQKPLTTNLRFTLALVKLPHLRSIPAQLHAAPAATMVLAGIEKKPLAGPGRTSADER